MASKVDIWNLALAHIGHRSNIADPDEASVEANHCRRFYPIALGTSLERHAWGFATRREALAQVDNPVERWAFAYARPNLCIRPLAVLPPGSLSEADAQPYEIEASEAGEVIILTNMEDAVLRYTVLVTDTVKFSNLFVLALSYDLASMLVGPIPKDVKLKKAMADWAAYWAEEASASDANASRGTTYRDFTPSNIAARNK